MTKAIVLAVKYEEPDWQNTWSCLKKLDAPVLVLDRRGIGSLAKCFNDGFNSIKTEHFDYVWMITNVVFNDHLFKKLIEAMSNTGYAAIHPSFQSDHAHVRPLKKDSITEVPFIEFTAPMIRTEVFSAIQLDEEMPYWGHDLDWGHRIREAGFKIGVHHGVELQHTYIRNNHQGYAVTEARKKLRKATDESTREKLIVKYGPDWRQFLKYK